MALNVDVGSATAEAYISVTDADAYHSARGHTAWAALETPVKEQALRIGAAYLDGQYTFKGRRTDEEQAMAWPREGVQDNDGYSVDDDVIPVKVKYANAEAALLHSDGTELTPNLERGGNVYKTREKVGPLEEETTYTLTASSRTTFTILDSLLATYLMSGTNNRKLIRS